VVTVPDVTNEFDYFVTQLHVRTYGFEELGPDHEDDRDSECVYRGHTQIIADTVSEAVPETDVELDTLQQHEGVHAVPDGGHTQPVRVGDHVTDREEDEGATMVVVERTGHTAREYRLEGSSKTVADVNEDYPAADDVVEVVYPERETERLGDLKQYAFPVSRLQVTNPVHSQDEEGDHA